MQSNFAGLNSNLLFQNIFVEIVSLICSQVKDVTHIEAMNMVYCRPAAHFPTFQHSFQIFPLNFVSPDCWSTSQLAQLLVSPVAGTVHPIHTVIILLK